MGREWYKIQQKEIRTIPDSTFLLVQSTPNGKGGLNKINFITAGDFILSPQISSLITGIIGPHTNGIYGGSGSLIGPTVVTTGADDLTFTATTGNILFNNNVGPNPTLLIDGATNTIGMGGNATLTEQLSIYNTTGSGNTTALGIYGNNTTGNQRAAYINTTAAATNNTALQVNASGAATGNYALLVEEGNVGIGILTPTETVEIGALGNVATLKFVDGNQAAGHVLTSDANGVATWIANPGVTTNIYTSNGTTASGRTVTLTDTLQFIGGQVDVTAGTTDTGATVLSSEKADMSNIVEFNDRAQGRVNSGAFITCAQFEVASDTRGFLPPRNTDPVNNIPGPVEGLIAWDSTDNELQVFDSANWVTLSGSTGTVTSVATAGTVNGLTLTGGPITTTGTVTLGGTLAINNSDWSGADLSVANGGTGQSSLDDITSAVGNRITVTGGTGTVVGGDVTLDVNQANLDLASIGGQIVLTSQVTGDLPIADGGTGQSTAQLAINALSAVSGAAAGEVLTKVGVNAVFAAIPDAKRTWNWGAARNSVNVTNQYIRTFNGTPNNLCPYVIPFNCILTDITCSTLAVETWDAQVHVNGASVAQVAVVAAQTGTNIGLSVAISAGDQVAFYCNGTAIGYPHIQAWFRET